MKTNHKLTFGALATFIFGCLTVACNSSEDVLTTLPSSATVRSFSLEADDDILPNLDSVFFSIDIYSQEIFNADSLPFGTKVNSLVPVITTESASVVEIIVPGNGDNEEKKINYLENTTDTVDFTDPVKLRVVSYDGATERNYTIKVNVHQIPSDTLVWSRLTGVSLPTVFNAVSEQHTTMSPGGSFFCLTAYEGGYAVATTTNPTGKWDIVRCAVDFTPNINSFTATNEALFVLDTSGLLHTSADNGATWTDTGTRSDAIIGAYGKRLITSIQEDSGWFLGAYPDSSGLTPAPADFPVMNTSNAVTIQFEMSTSPQMIISGGRTAEGELSADTWGYDGRTWAKISRDPLPKKLENMAVVPYYDIKIDSISWKVSPRRSVLLGLCGNTEDGNPNGTVYISADFGLTWAEAPANMQMPQSVIPLRTNAQAFPYVGVKYAGRATAPITHWDVPYIYLFGGVSAQGVTYNTIFRGVITQFTQKPLQ